MNAGMNATSFPVVASIVHPDYVTMEIEGRYDAGSVTTCRLVERGLNDTYVVHTTRASYVARVYRFGWRSPSAITYELDFLRHLKAKGVPVSTAVTASDETAMQTVMAPEGSRHLVLFTYAEGQSVPWNDDHAGLAGRLLAEIHDAARDFRPSADREKFGLEELINKPLVALEPFLGRCREDWMFLRQFADRLWSYAEPIVNAGLKWGVCHGDFDAHNVHVSGGCRLTAFDFDFCGPGWYVFDLVVPKWGAMSVRKMSVWDAFLNGYLERHPLDENDLQALPLFQTLRHLWGMGLRARRVNGRGIHSLSPAYVQYRVRAFKAWEKQYRGQV